jgi:hypothetical protein
MMQPLQTHSIPIILAVIFYIVGFFAVADVLELPDHDIVLGLVAGAAGGLCVLCAVLWNDRKLIASASPQI